MENRLLEILNGCHEDAAALEETEKMENYDVDITEEVQAALVRLSVAISLDVKLDKCEVFLSEDSTEEITDAYFAAQEAISKAMDEAIAVIDEYLENEKEFEERIDLLSVNTASAGIADDLLKLYKCEKIIRMAYQSAQQFPLYGGPGNALAHIMDEDEDPIITDQERYIKKKMGVDIPALREIRENLAKEIKRKMPM